MTKSRSIEIDERSHGLLSSTRARWTRYQNDTCVGQALRGGLTGVVAKAVAEGGLNGFMLAANLLTYL
eukprot:1544923-Pleurochrysis_carterae.AAC.3